MGKHLAEREKKKRLIESGMTRLYAAGPSLPNEKEIKNEVHASPAHAKIK
jgi:hypothetical protein